MPKLLRISATLLFLVSAGFCVPTASAASRLSNSPKSISVSLSPDHWTSVPLPFEPTSVSTHGSDLWVCGWNEGVAESTDGGKTWSVLHVRKGGQIFYSLSFEGKQIFAAATGGYILRSRDGGRTWKPWLPVSVTPKQIALCGGAVVASAPGILEFTSNFSSPHPQWSHLAVDDVPGIKDQGPLSKVGCIDSQHWGELVPAEESGGNGPSQPARLIETTDGGKHWGAATLPKTWRPSYLATRDGEYEVFGALRPPKSPMGGLAAYSSDGVHWGLWPQPLGDWLSLCSGFSCREGDGWADFGTDPARFWRFPKKGPLLATAEAYVGNVTCVSGLRVACALGKSTDQVSLEPQVAKRKVPKKVPGKVVAAKCLRCEPGSYPARAKLAGCSGVVVLQTLILPTGRLQKPELIYSPCVDLAVAARNVVSTWVYRPTTLNGRAVTVDTHVTVNYSMGP